jgi:hypothetical protein
MKVLTATVVSWLLRKLGMLVFRAARWLLDLAYAAEDWAGIGEWSTLPDGIWMLAGYAKQDAPGGWMTGKAVGDYIDPADLKPGGTPDE